MVIFKLAEFLLLLAGAGPNAFNALQKQMENLKAELNDCKVKPC